MLTCPAQVVWFKELARWDPASYIPIEWHWSKKVMAPISTVLCERKEKVDRAQFDFANLQPITIHFGGSIDRRKMNDGQEYSMDLFFARPGDIVVAKIDLKNGAVGIVPDWQNVAVTNHFVVYEPDRTKVLPEYLLRIIQANFFKSYLWRNKVGAEGRKEVKIDFFESVEIPLPPLDTQRAIVARWQTAQAEIAATVERVQRLEVRISENALADTGITLKPLLKKSKAFAFWFREIERFGVEFNRWMWTLEDLLTSDKFPSQKLSAMAYINPQNDVSLRTEDLVTFVPMEAVSEESGEIETLQSKQYREVKSGYTHFVDGDVIWAKITPCMQNGKCAIASNLQNGVGFGSTEFHVIRSKNPNELLPAYIWTLLRLGHIRSAAQRYLIGSAGQQRVPSEFLEDLHIPVPPLAVQREIVRRVQEGRAQIARERESANRKSEEAKAEIEAMILGTKDPRS